MRGRLEEKRKSTPKGCTFQPKIDAVSANMRGTTTPSDAPARNGRVDAAATTVIV